MTPQQLTKQYPTLYHMAELSNWTNIQKFGLLSTTALLDLFGTSGETRAQIESKWRPRSCKLDHPTYGTAVIRDQLPMPDFKLSDCLVGMTTQEWYELINGKTFFWLDQTPLGWMLNAAPYRGREHAVIIVSTEALLSYHLKKVKLSSINSGSVNPAKATGAPRIRGRNTFLPVGDYEERWVSELTVEYSVPNILDLAVRVEAWRGKNPLRIIWNREDAS